MKKDSLTKMARLFFFLYRIDAEKEIYFLLGYSYNMVKVWGRGKCA